MSPARTLSQQALVEAAGPKKPKRRKSQSIAMKAAWADPKVRRRMIKASLLVRATPEYRAKRSAIAKALWADPTTRARLLAGLSKPSARKKNGAKAKARWADPKMRKRMIKAMKAGWAVRAARS